MPRALAWLVTFILVDMLWIMFYAPNVSEGFYVWGRIWSFADMHISADIFSLFVMNEINMILNMLGPIGALPATYNEWYMIMYLALAFIICLCCKNLHEEKFVPTPGKAILSALLMIWAVVSFSGVSPFLYFNF